VVAPLAPTVAWVSSISTVSGASAIFAAECVVGFIVAAVIADDNGGTVEERAIRNAVGRGVGALLFGAAALGAIIYDNHNISTQKAAQSMYAAGDLGPRTFRENYNITPQTYVFTFVGKKYHWNPLGLITQGNSPALKSNLVDCTMYWGAYADVDRRLAATTKPLKPDFRSKPDYTFGACQGLVNLIYGS